MIEIGLGGSKAEERQVRNAYKILICKLGRYRWSWYVRVNWMEFTLSFETWSEKLLTGWKLWRLGHCELWTGWWDVRFSRASSVFGRRKRQLLKATLDTWFRKITTIALCLPEQATNKVRLTYGLPGVLKNIFQILGKMPWTYVYKAACRHCVFRHVVGIRRSLGHGATSNRRPDVEVGMRLIGRQLWAET